MAINSWIQDLQTKLNEQCDLTEKYKHLGMQLYLFGSATKSETPRDLDILVLYPRNAMTQAIELRNATVQYIKDLFGLPVDSVLLSFEEEQQVLFAVKERAVLIFPTVEI